MIYASGILPVSRTPEGKLVFLLGKDVRDGTWSDFGGKVERPDAGPLDTAAREFYEETLGVVAPRAGMRQRMIPSNCVVLRGTTQNGHPYWMFVMEVPYSASVRNHFLKSAAFLKSKNLLALVEKVDVAWVDLETLWIIPKRGVFERTVRRNRGVLERIASQPWKAVCRSRMQDEDSMATCDAGDERESKDA